MHDDYMLEFAIAKLNTKIKVNMCNNVIIIVYKFP